MKLALESLEGCGPETTLAEAALEFFQVENVSQALQCLYDVKSELRQLADFAPHVFQHAARGDRVSLDLLNHEAATLIPILTIVRRRTDLDQAIGLTGGIAELWKPFLESAMMQHSSPATFVHIGKLPVFGATILAKNWEQEGRPYLYDEWH
jgi:N-acetylglucosamine kinase-like BadF-type ATPase